MSQPIKVVRALDSRCPVCSAAPKRVCRLFSGKRAPETHALREQAAIRATVG